MADWKAAEDAEYRDFFYIEELSSNDGTTQRLTGISVTETVQHLKRAIAQHLGNPGSWSSITVIYTGQELTNLDATLQSYEIEDGDTIFFTRAVTPEQPRRRPQQTREQPPPYPGVKCLQNVMFYHFDGYTITLQSVPLNGTVKQLRDRLCAEKALDAESLRFLYGSKQLQDENALDMYDLTENCTIHIVSRVKGGF